MILVSGSRSNSATQVNYNMETVVDLLSALNKVLAWSQESKGAEFTIYLNDKTNHYVL